MAGRFNIELLGDKELAKTFSELPDALERKVLNRALRQGANYLKAITEPRIPRDPNRKRAGTHTADTLTVKALKRSRRRIGYRIQTGTREQLGIDPKDKYYYPVATELGNRKTPPQAPMRIALRSGKEAVLAVVRMEVDAGIERELAKRG